MVIMKKGGLYYLLTSGKSGWDPNPLKYSVSTSLTEVWSDWKTIADRISYGSQCTSFLQISGTSDTSYFYVGDRWKDPALPVSKTFIYPLTLTDGTIDIQYVYEFNFDLEKGTWASFDDSEYIAQENWTVLSSTSGIAGNHTANKAIDNDPNTFGQTSGSSSHPHEHVINLGALYQLTECTYLPHQGDNENGIIREFQISVSTNGINWEAAAEGTWGNARNEKWILLDTVNAQYVKLTAHSEINKNVFASVAEIGLYAKKVIATGATHLPLKNSGTKILVYPNLAKNSFYVVLKEMKNAVVSVYNSDGGRICELKRNESLVEFKTDSLFKSGLYFIKVKDENDNYYTRKLIVV